MALSLDEVLVNLVEGEKDDDSTTTANFVDEGNTPINSNPNRLNSKKIWYF